LRTERSVDRHGASSGKCGAIRRRREAGETGQRSDPKTGDERPASSTEQFVIGAKALSVEHGAIQARHERKESRAEQSANDTERQVSNAESNRLPTPGRRSWKRSNLPTARNVKRRTWSNSWPVRTAKCGGQQLGWCGVRGSSEVTQTTAR